MNQFLDHALKYAVHGWHVHPLAPRQKNPLTKHGVKDATTNEKQIRAWWKKWPDANIAVACGEKSGIWVIDIDVDKKKKISGMESLKEFPPLPETVKQLTPGGGFHAFYRTNDAPANRNSFRSGIDIRGNGYYVVITPSVHPNGGSYNWGNNLAPWQVELAEFPNFMRPTMKAPWAARPAITFKSAPITFDSTLPGFPDDEVLRRASLYLAECDPAIQGSGGHDKLLWAASAMVHGFLLTDGQAIDILLKEYNPRCVPPWNLDSPKDNKDFRRKITEARRLTPRNPPGWLLNDPAYVPVDIANVNIDALIANAKQLGKTETFMMGLGEKLRAIKADDDIAIHSELQFLTRPTGLLGEICSWINETAMREQPFLTLACVLTFCGALFGRKVRDEIGSRTNLYCMGVAESSAGKFHAPKQIRRLCAAAGCINLLGGTDTASDSAIEKRMAEEPTTLFLWDEIGHFLSYIKSGANQHQVKIVPLLMQLYSASGSIFTGKEYAEDGKQRTLVQPCCCIYGTSDPYRFAGGITEEELHDGWLSRCLIFTTENDPPKKYIPEASIPIGIIEQVREWSLRENNHLIENNDISSFVEGSSASMISAPPKQLIIPTDASAKRIFINFDKEAVSIGKEIPRLNCLWRKAEENARRIAVIVAASESFDNSRITPAVADYACRLIRFLLTDFSEKTAKAITSNQIDFQKQKLLAIIAEVGIRGCLTREITKAASWSTRKLRKDLLEDLVEAGEIVLRPCGKGVRHWTMKNFLKFEKQRKEKNNV